jgi:hypothetical protein
MCAIVAVVVVFRAVVLSVAVERWALSFEAMLKGGDVVVDVDVDVVCCLHYMLFVCCWPPKAPGQDRINTVTAFDRVIPGAGPGLVLAVAHSEHTYIPIPFKFLVLLG